MVVGAGCSTSAISAWLKNYTTFVIRQDFRLRIWSYKMVSTHNSHWLQWGAAGLGPRAFDVLYNPPFLVVVVLGKVDTKIMETFKGGYIAGWYSERWDLKIQYLGSDLGSFKPFKKDENPIVQTIQIFYLGPGGLQDLRIIRPTWVTGEETGWNGDGKFWITD